MTRAIASYLEIAYTKDKSVLVAYDTSFLADQFARTTALVWGVDLNMKTLANLLTSLLVAVWVIAIAILSVQNAQPVSLRFFTFQSIQLPVGLLLAFCVGLGIIGTALIQPLWSLAGSGQGNSQAENDLDEDF